MTDAYLQNPELLNGQPKRTIADYVEQNGILVPRRFDSLAEARRSHKAIFLRSEHPQDYDGVSGLLDSFRLSDELVKGSSYSTRFSPKGCDSIEQIRSLYFDFLASKDPDTSKLQNFCSFLDLDQLAFENEVSFSIWEYLEGINRTIVADSAIPDRHHIFSFTNEPHTLAKYHLVEKGKIIQEYGWSSENYLATDIFELLEIYENVRSLNKFDPTHCPILEFQTHKGKHYFLQYHRARNFTPTEFSLVRKPHRSEMEVHFVRGCTSSEGMNCKITFYYSGIKDGNYNPEDEEGSFDLISNPIFSELRVRKRKIQIIPENKLNFAMLKFASKHQNISKLFKPQVSIIHNLRDLVSTQASAKLYKEIKTGGNSHINLHIVSDGRKAYIQRI